MSKTHLKFILLSFLAFSSSGLYTQSLAQANFWSLFGDMGCVPNKRMSTVVAPSATSFNQIPQLWDYATSGPQALSKTQYKNSTFDNAGNLLFSVNGNGIYDKNGDQIINFGISITKILACPSDPEREITATPVCANSEVIAVPVANDCHSYYVLFWSKIYVGEIGAHDYRGLLRVVTVRVNPVSGLASVVNSDVLNTFDCDGFDYFQNAQALQIAAAPINADGTAIFIPCTQKAPPMPLMMPDCYAGASLPPVYCPLLLQL